jgi:hypothetical protein
MAVTYYTYNPGGSIGPDIVSKGEWQQSGQRWYVCSVNGSDAASPRGLSRNRPLATFSQAYTNASAGDVVQFLGGHSEVITSKKTIAKGIYFVSEETGTARATFTANVEGADSMFFATAANVVFDNLYFPKSLSAANNARIEVRNIGTRFIRSDFECGSFDTVPSVFYTDATQQPDYGSVKDCSFISVATALTAQPSTGLGLFGHIDSFIVENTVFDGGNYGWSDAALKMNALSSAFEFNGVSLLRNSNINILATSTGRIYIKDKTGSSRIEWSA